METRIKIPTKNKLIKELVLESLFVQGGTLNESVLRGLPVWKYCTGGYKSNEITIDWETNHIKDTPVFAVRRGDKDGRFTRIMCFDDNPTMMNDIQRKEHAKAIVVWRKIKEKLCKTENVSDLVPKKDCVINDVFNGAIEADYHRKEYCRKNCQI